MEVRNIMENKEIIIAITIIAVLAYLYWQNRQESLNTLSPENDTKLKDLQNQVQHYQKLYQQRVEKDLTGNQAQEIQQLNQQLEQTVQDYQEINEELIQVKEYNQLYQQKITDLENSLLNLAKQKLKGKKEAQRLLSELETNWKQDKENWLKEKQKLAARTSTSTQTNLTKLGMTGLTLHWEQYNEWAKELGVNTGNKFGGWNLEEVQAKYKEKLTQEFATETQPLITDLKAQITKKEQELKELTETSQQITNSKSILVNRLGKKEEELVNLREQVSHLGQEQQEQLRKINVLFDENAVNYETIDFDGLCSLLEKIKQQKQDYLVKSQTQEQTITQLTKELSQVQDNYNQQIKELETNQQEKITDLQNSLTQANSKIEQLESEQKENEKVLEQLGKEFQDLSKELE